MILKQSYRSVSSDTAAAAYSTPINVGGRQVSVDVRAPASLGAVQGSNDLTQWTNCTSRVDGSTALTSLADNTHNEVFERFRYLRVGAALDGSGPRTFQFLIEQQVEHDT